MWISEVGIFSTFSHSISSRSHCFAYYTNECHKLSLFQFIKDCSLETTLAELSRSTYSWEELQRRPLPDGVDPAKLEKYLSDQDFQVRRGPGMLGFMQDLWKIKFTRINTSEFMTWVTFIDSFTGSVISLDTYIRWESYAGPNVYVFEPVFSSAVAVQFSVARKLRNYWLKSKILTCWATFETLLGWFL